jgi:phosphate transport system substrate-binding protein
VLFQALAKEVERGGEVVVNPYRSWREIDASLPDTPIVVLGPPTTSGTYDALLDLALVPGCTAIPALAALPAERRATVCRTLRDDGAYIPAGEDDERLAVRLEQEPGKLGLFGYSFLAAHADLLTGSPFEGVAPTPETIADGSYKLARRLFVYVKAEHAPVVRALRPFLRELTSEAAVGEEGYLTEAGLVPLTPAERALMAERARTLTPMAP